MTSLILAGIGALLLALAVLLVAVPLIFWLDRRRLLASQGRLEPQPADVFGVPAGSPLEVARAVAAVLSETRIARLPIDPSWVRVAPLVLIAISLIPIAFMPFGYVYSFFSTDDLALVLVDSRWSLVFVVAAPLLSTALLVATGLSGGRVESVQGAMRGVALTVSSGVALLLAALAPAVLFGSLSLVEIAKAQDASFAPFLAFSAAGGLPEGGSLLARLPETIRSLATSLPFPRCGIFFDPFGAALLWLCAMVTAQRPPFDAATVFARFGFGVTGEYRGTRLALFGSAGIAMQIALCGLVVVCFLGGAAIPYLPQTAIVAAIVPYLGVGVANGLCLAAHLGCFVTKLAIVLVMTISIAHRLPRPSASGLIAFCWRWLLPLSALHLLVVVVFVWLQGGAVPR